MVEKWALPRDGNSVELEVEMSVSFSVVSSDGLQAEEKVELKAIVKVE